MLLYDGGHTAQVRSITLESGTDDSVSACIDCFSRVSTQDMAEKARMLR